MWAADAVQSETLPHSQCENTDHIRLSQTDGPQEITLLSSGTAALKTDGVETMLTASTFQELLQVTLTSTKLIDCESLKEIAVIFQDHWLRYYYIFIHI